MWDVNFRVNLRVMAALIKRFDFWFLAANCFFILLSGTDFPVCLMYYTIVYGLCCLCPFFFNASGCILHSNNASRLLCSTMAAFIGFTMLMLDASRQSTRARMLYPAAFGALCYFALGLFIYFFQVYRFRHHIVYFIVSFDNIFVACELMLCYLNPNFSCRLQFICVFTSQFSFFPLEI